MNILRRAQFHQNLFSTAEDAYPGSPLSAPIQTQLSHHLSGGMIVENALAYTATFVLASGGPTTWVAGSLIYLAGFYDTGDPEFLTQVPLTILNKNEFNSGTGGVAPTQVRLAFNTTITPTAWLAQFPKFWGVVLHGKSGQKVPLTIMTQQAATIIRAEGTARFDSSSLAVGDAFTVKLYYTGNPQ